MSMCQLWYSWYSVVRDRCCYSIFILLITAWIGVCVLTSTGLWSRPVSQQPPCSPRDQSPIPSSPQNPVAVWFLDPGWLSCCILSSFFFLLIPRLLTCFSLLNSAVPAVAKGQGCAMWVAVITRVVWQRSRRAPTYQNPLPEKCAQ